MLRPCNHITRKTVGSQRAAPDIYYAARRLLTTFDSDEYPMLPPHGSMNRRVTAMADT
ncbi:hypothetical protein BAC2_02976 [uncultured bacterium]|nr:hypothetical protein BAC2_02976 [uncultured bacterium]